MVQTYQSVYLSLPRHRPDPAAERRRRRRSAAGALTAIGLVAATATAVFGLARWVTATPTVAVTAVDSALDDPIGRAEMVRELDRLVHENLLDPVAVETAESFGVDVDTAVSTWADAAADDPAVRAALDDLVVEVHGRILVAPDSRPLGVDDLTTAIADVIERTSPELTGLVADDAHLLAVDGAGLPDLTAPAARLPEALTLSAALLLTLPLAVLVHPERHRVFTWFGRWLLGTAIVGAVLAVAAPYLAGGATGSSIVEIAVRSVSLDLVVPAGLAGIVGAGVMTAAATAARTAATRTAQRGAAAALGAFEPLPGLPTPHRPPTVDLTGRGLVDAGRPLTNL